MFVAFLMAAGLSMDAFAVAVANGIVNRGLKKKTLLVMSFLFGGFQFLMPLAGYALGVAVSDYVRSVDHWVAFVLLGFIGGKMIFEGLRSGDDAPPRRLTVPALLVQAVATSIDALAVGVTLAFITSDIFLYCTVIGAVCFCATLLGGLLGARVGALLRKRAEITGGLVLVGIGAKILIEHLFFAG